MKDGLTLNDCLLLVKKSWYSPRLQKLRLLLTILAEEGELYQYEIYKELGWSYRTILRLFDLLNEIHFAKIIRTEPSSKGGKDKNVWGITQKGSQFLDYLNKGELK
jgi:DNA-binding PadR family transcriptional regulator